MTFLYSVHRARAGAAQQLTFSLSSDRERLSMLRHERICSCSSRENGWDRLLRNSSAGRGGERKTV